LRLELTKVRKHNSPIPIDGANLMLTEDCKKSQNQTSLSEAETVIFDDITHCPIN
jgi:hypothetical protein